MTYIKYNGKDGTPIYIECEDIDDSSSSGDLLVSGRDETVQKVIDKTTETFGNAISSMKAVIDEVHQTISSCDVCPDEVEVSMKFKAAADAGVVLTKLEAEGTFKIKLKWSKEGKKDQD